MLMATLRSQCRTYAAAAASRAAFRLSGSAAARVLMASTVNKHSSSGSVLYVSMNATARKPGTGTVFVVVNPTTDTSSSLSLSSSAIFNRPFVGAVFFVFVAEMALLFARAVLLTGAD
jgi:hypothetical protein